MKVEELRIGNLLVGPDISNSHTKTQQVIGISCLTSDEGDVYRYVIQTNVQSWGIGNLSPIPLTEDWLLKFGFDMKYGNTYLKDRMKFDINTIGLVRFHWSQKVTYIKYVHQLQNLYFALTGQELKLT